MRPTLVRLLISCLVVGLFSSGIAASIQQSNQTLNEARQQAEQYKWNGQLSRSIVIFDLILQAEPNNVDVLNSKAEVLSWQDKLEAALALYQKVLTIEPGNLTALKGQARMIVWQGQNRQGLSLYRQILKTYPSDIDTLLGLARVQSWDGRDDLAMLTINQVLTLNPKNQEANKLKLGILQAQTFYVNQFNYHSSDKNNLDIIYNGIRTGQHFDLLTAAELIYQKQRSFNITEVSGQRIGLGIDKRFSDLVELNSFLYSNDYDAIGFKPFTTNTWLTLRPNDVWRLDISYNREIFEDVGSLNNKIIIDRAGLSADYKPDRFWLWSVILKNSSYSDGNAQNTLFGQIEYRWCNDPYVKVYYNCYYSNWGQQLNMGYFNPKSILSQSLGIFTSHNMTKQLYADLRFSLGYENQQPAVDHPTYFLGAGLNYRFSNNWLANLRGEAFEATPDPNSNGYSKTSFTFGLTYNFEVNPPALFNTQSPSRVINY